MWNIIGHISRRDYLVLAEKYPEEFERLICCLKLLPYKGRGSEIAIGSDYLYKGSDGKVRVWNDYIKNDDDLRWHKWLLCTV